MTRAIENRDPAANGPLPADAQIAEVRRLVSVPPHADLCPCILCREDVPRIARAIATRDARIDELERALAERTSHVIVSGARALACSEAVAAAFVTERTEGRRERRKLPPEVARILALYESGREWPAWECEACGGSYPRDIVTACPMCSRAALVYLTATTPKE